MESNVKVFKVGYLPQLLFEFLLLWFIDSIKYILRLTFGVILLILDLFALPILLKTFFLPYRAENRKGFVIIAIGLGIVLRLVSILSCLILILVTLGFGFIIAIFWLLIPIVITYLLFTSLFSLFV